MAPIVDRIEDVYSKQIVVKRINANEGDGPAIMQEYHIPGHPTTLIFNQHEQEVQRLIGPQPAEVIEETLQEILK